MTSSANRHEPCSRREFLVAATALVGAAGVLAACGGGASIAVATSATSAPAAPATTAASTASASTARAASSTTASAAATSATVPASSAASAARPGALQVWMPNKSFSLTEGVGAALAKDYLAQHPGLSIDAIVEGSIDKFKTQVAGGTPPDLFHTQSYVQTTWGVTGVVQPLDGFIAKAKNIKPADIWKYKWAEVAWQGKTYAVPYSVDNRVVYVNDDLYRRAGLDAQQPPASWSEMEAAVSKTAQLDGTQLKLLGWDPFGGSGGRLTWLVPFWQLGGDFAPGDGSKVAIANDMGVTSLEWVRKILDMQGGFDVVAAYTKANSPDGTGEKVFAASHAAQIYATVASKVQVFADVPNLSYHVGQYPLPPNGKTATYAGGWAFCIGTGAKHADDAASLIDYFYAPDVQVKWAVAQLRVPPSMSVAQSVDYTRNDPLLKLTVEAMPNGRFVPSVPGGEQILPILNTMVADVMQKKAGAQQALQDAQQRCQLELDKYRK